MFPSSISNISQTIGWNLPPNADSNVTAAADYMFAPVSRLCVRHHNKWGYIKCDSSAPLETALNTVTGGDFTIEVGSPALPHPLDEGVLPEIFEQNKEVLSVLLS